MKCKCKIVFLVLLLSFVQFSYGSAIHVDLNAKGRGNGSKWADAYTDLQSALKSIKKGDTVLIAQGTYYPAQENENREKSFVIKPGVTVIGGFKHGGKLRNWKEFKTTLSGDIKRDDIYNGDSLLNNENNVYHVIVCDGLESVTIDGLIITGGYSKKEDYEKKRFNGYGAGLYIHIWNPKNTAYLTMRNCIITGNVAFSRGGGLYFEGSQCILERCSFVNNTISDSGSTPLVCGGAAYIQSFSAVMDSIYWGRNGAVKGGALTYKGKKAVLNKNEFHSNRALEKGGALWFSGEDLVISKITCEGNFSSGGKGGVLSFEGRNLFVTGMKANKNSASGIGGVIDFQGDTAVIDSAVLTENSGGESGGCFRFLGKQLSINKSTFTENKALRGSGGVIYFEGHNCTISNSKFKANSASEYGGALEFRGRLLECKKSGFLNNGSDLKNGGAIDFKGDSCVFEKNTFTDNSAQKGSGGALGLRGKVFRIEKTPFTSNKASVGGAIFCDHDVNLIKRDSVYYEGLCINEGKFVSNSASLSGGAISWMGKGVIHNSTFEKNTAKQGGAIQGWLNVIGSKILFRNDSLVVDSNRISQELLVSIQSVISKTLFRNNDADEGKIAADWVGTFNSCSFFPEKIDLAGRIKPLKLDDSEQRPVFTEN